MSDRTVSVSLIARVQGYVGAMATASAATTELGAKVTDLAAKSETKFSKLSKGATVAGLALVAVFAMAEKELLGFDKQMSAVGAVADATSSQMLALRSAALKAGQDTAFTATQAAQAEEELAKAGISAADILSGGLSGALSLAAAGNLDLATAATIAAQAMTEFGLKGKDVAHIADVLTAGANKSATDVTALGDSLNQVGSVAHNTGFSLNETVGVLAAFAQYGLVGSDAGTTLKTMLLKLQAPSQQSAALMKSLGLNVYDAQGHFVSAAGLAGQLQSALSGLTDAQRNAALGTIFGTRAIRGAVDLYRLGTGGVEDWTRKVNDAGAAQDTAAKKLDNLSGDLKKLEGSLQAAAITSTQHATPALRFLAQGANDLTNSFSHLPSAVQTTTAVLGGLTGVLLLGTVGFVKTKAAADNFMDTLIGFGPAGEKAAAGLGTLAKGSGTLALVAIGSYAAAKGISFLYDRLYPAAPKIKIVANSVDDLSASLRNLAKSGVVDTNMASIFGSDLSKLADNLKVLNAGALITPDSHSTFIERQAMDAINEKLNDSGRGLAQARQNVGDLNKSLVDLVQNGGVAQADLAFNDITKKLLALGVPMSEITKDFGGYEAAASAAAIGTTSAGAGFATTSQQADLMSRSLGDAIDKVGSLDAAFKELNGGQIDSTQALIDYKNSLADLTGQLKKNGDSLSLNTQKGRDNVAGILDIIKKAETVAQATYTQTNSVDKASAAWDKQIDALKATLKAAGFTNTQIQTLLDTYAKMPPLVATPVSAPGLDATLKKAQELAKALNAFPSGVSTKISLSGANRHMLNQPNADGGIYTHAANGSLRNASIFSAVTSGARYAYAEPQTEGELFVPKKGDYGRAIGLLGEGAAWYGATIVPGGARGWDGASAPVTYHHETNIFPQRADFTMADLRARDAELAAYDRYGRAR